MNLVVYTSFDEGASNRTKIWLECEQSVRDWCDRMGATLVNLPKRKFQPQWVIFDAFRRSIEDGVDRAAWIDCDILVQKDAPDIFASLPDRHYYCQPDPVRRIHPRMRRHWRRFGAVNPRPYLVSALVSWSPRHVEALVEWFDAELERETQRFGKKDGDQELLTVALQETETHHSYYPPHYHKMSRWVKQDTPFMHAAGSKKPRKIKRFKSMSKRRKGKGAADD